MSGPEYDAVIAGGGLSGLSLAAHLATAGWRDRAVLVVDDGAAPAAAGWAFWSAGPGLLESAVSHSYGQVRVHAAGSSRTLPLGRYRYRVVRRADLRRVALALVQGCPRYAVRQGRVTAIRDDGDSAEVVVDGRAVRARWAFDSVTPRPTDAGVDARLAFTGWEVRCTRPVLDPATPTLFDFRVPQDGGARFAYVLPYDQHRALVELTGFVPGWMPPPTAAARRDGLAGYLHDVLDCDAYEITHTESAVLPLSADLPGRARGSVVPIGVRGGLVKASTGYAYQRIQRDSAAIASSLVRRGHPFDRRTGRRRHRLLDAVLLDVLNRDPPQLERAFARLFLANPAERVLRFLDEDTGLGDELRLITSLPPAPYVRAVAARMIRALRH